MKKFIVNLFSNRFGIVLATINLCYFASLGFDPFGIRYQLIFFLLNLPAILLTYLSGLGVRISVSAIISPTEMFFAKLLFTSLMIFQWLFIAWLAKTLAAQIRKIIRQ